MAAKCKYDHSKAPERWTRCPFCGASLKIKKLTPSQKQLQQRDPNNIKTR